MAKLPDIQVRYGRVVRAMRDEMGISQEAFAHKCGLDRTYISGIERGRRNISLQNIEVIAKAFGVSIADMMAKL